MIFGYLYLLCFFASIILFAFILRMYRTGIGKRLIVLSLLITLWLLMEGLSFYIRDEAVVLLFQKWKYVGVIFVPPVLVFTAIQFIHQDKIYSMWIRILIFVIPALSFLSMVSGNIPYHFATGQVVYFDGAIPMYNYKKEIGFMINAIYSYLLILFTCYLLIVQTVRSPKIYRIQNFLVFLGCFVSMGLNVLFITGSFGTIKIDTTPMFVFMTLLVFYFGSFILPRSMIIPYARNLLVENMKDLIFVVDNADLLLDLNPSALQIVKEYSKIYKGKRLADVKLIGVPIERVLKSLPTFSEKSVEESFFSERMMYFHTEEKMLCFRMVEEEIYDANHNKIGRLFLLHDVTLSQEYLNRILKMNERMLISDQIIENSLEGILISDPNNRIIRVNSSMEKMSGYSKEEILGKKPNLFRSERHDRRFYEQMWESIQKEGFWEGEIWDKRKNGEVYPKWMSITTMLDEQGNLKNYIAISSDLSKMKKAEKDIQLLAYYDSLTGIPNRTLFHDRLQTALVRAKRSDHGVALLTIDIDGFKMINDNFGHGIGDGLLIAFVQRTKQYIRESDTLSRVGGDEFTLILENVDKPYHVKKITENLLAKLHEPYYISGHEINITVSIGIAQAPYEDMTTEGMIRKSDTAMYYIKKTGGGKFIFSSEEIERRNQELYEMQLEIKRAIREREFMLYLQPQVALFEGKKRIVGAEALIRWENPGHGLVAPNRFIPAAEANGLIVPIGSWVMEEIFRLDRYLQEKGIRIKLAFNVSVKQFEHDDFLPLLRRLVEENSDLNFSLTVEITESLFIDDLDRAILMMNDIKALGLKIALDDFGTGFSSMSYLTKLPIDYLKIDQSFVAQIEQTKKTNLAFMILQMARTLGLVAVAEGVETVEQEEQLLNAQCDIMQGYLYAKPLPVEEFINYYQEYCD